jgi:hypothetical protein
LAGLLRLRQDTFITAEMLIVGARDTLLSTENALSKSKSALSFLHRTSVDLQIGNDRIRRKGGMRATNVVNDSTLRRGRNSFSPRTPLCRLNALFNALFGAAGYDPALGFVARPFLLGHCLVQTPAALKAGRHYTVCY